MPPLFTVLCSDLSRYSVADAVAASMAVPVVFAPIVIRTYPEKCEPLPPFIANFRQRPEAQREANAIARALAAYRDPRTRYIKLADGGLTDNFGVSTLTMSRVIYGTPYAPMTERDAVRIRRLLVVIVDASQGPHGDWTHHPAGPKAWTSRLPRPTPRSTRLRARSRCLRQHDRGMAGLGHQLPLRLDAGDLERLGAPARWDCKDVKFSLVHLAIDELASPVRERIEAVPTRLSLEPAQLDAAIEGAREGLLALPRLRRRIWQERSGRARGLQRARPPVQLVEHVLRRSSRGR